MANTYLTRTFGSTSNVFTWTISCWFKRSNLTNEHVIMSRKVNGSKYVTIKINGNNKLEYRVYNSADQARLVTTMKLMDTSGWYHFVLAQDSTLASASDRLKMYVNGERITAFDTETIIGQNVNGDFNTLAEHQIGAFAGADFFNGCMSDFNFIDGTQLTASSFGETDATTGEWKISDLATLTYGTNGFRILNDGNTITDQSANSNNWTSNGAGVTNTEDCPSDVFAVWNTEATVVYKQGNQTYANGNTSIIEAGGVYKSPPTTLGAFTGKYYCEIKMIGNINSSLLYSTMGGVITSDDVANLGDNYNHAGETAQSVGYGAYDGKTYISNVGTAYGATLADGNILGIALDLDNSKVYFSKNGAWQNSGDPTSGATGTGAVSLPSSTSSWHFIGSPTNSTISANFGNGYFGSTAIASEGTNASNIGKFEYDVPTGYTALSTKGLNS